MKRALTLSTVLIGALLLIGSCILDPKKEPPPKDDNNQGTFKSLKQKDDVLENLELLYNQRNYEQYDRLLDDNFIFFFSPDDYASGKTGEQWDRTAELRSASHLFDPGYSGKYDPIKKITAALDYASGDLTWEAKSPPEGSGFEGETWYQKHVIYDLTLETTGDMVFIAQDNQAVFVIRRAVAENDTIWRIVRWYDLGEGQ